jgi:hypothetical protein
MNIEIGNYVIIKIADRKYQLVKIISVNSINSIVCDKFQKFKNKAKYIELEDTESIVANLGKEPEFGSCFGIETEYLKSAIEDYPPWGSLFIYRKLTELEQRRLDKALNTVGKTLEKDRIFPTERPIDIFVKNRKGMDAGLYKRYSNPKKSDEIIVKPSEFSNLEYILFHETGHAVYYQSIDEILRAQWIREFYKNIKLKEDTEKLIRQMRKDLIEHDSVKAYKSDLDDEEKENLDHILKYINYNFDLTVKNINTLMVGNNDLSEIWPIHIDLPTKKALLTEYSLESPEELFAEAFALYYTNRELPKSISLLFKKTISVVRNSNQEEKYFKAKNN